MKRVIAMILLAALALSLAACGGAPKEVDPATAIVGKWKNEAGDVMEYKADGTGTCALGASGTRPCTWKYDEAGDRFVINYSTSDDFATVTKNDSGSLVITWKGETYKKIG